MKNFTLDQWIEWQCELHSTNMDFNLERIKEVAKRLNVDKTKLKVFTVAGTNGKGSTIALLESILIENNYKVGSYTSPHLLEFNERIKINKKHASTGEICKVFELIEEKRKDITLTFFEFSTLAAFKIFSQKNLDIIILEVGLGGRLDAVNIIDADVSIITSIGIDHTSILGNDLEQIAFEKAGVMRKNKPTIVGYKNIHKAIVTHSKNIGSNLSILNDNFSYKIHNKDKWNFSNDEGISYECDMPGIKGAIQINNAASAIQAILSCDDIDIKEKQLNLGLQKAQIYGRFQVISDSPKIILDIAHNEQSVISLIENLNKYYPRKNYHAVFSVLKDKKINKILELLKGYFKTWHISENENERSLSIRELKKNNFFDSEIMHDYASIDKAYNGALKEITDEDDIVIVFGSSYTVAPILKKYLEKNE